MSGAGVGTIAGDLPARTTERSGDVESRSPPIRSCGTSELVKRALHDPDLAALHEPGNFGIVRAPYFRKLLVDERGECGTFLFERVRYLFG